jgi:hypothetical protein
MDLEHDKLKIPPARAEKPVLCGRELRPLPLRQIK